MKKNRRVLSEDPFCFLINYWLTIEGMIVAGKYGMKNCKITAGNFPIRSEGIVEVEARYLKFDWNMKTEEVLSEIKSMDTKNLWIPGMIEHVLAISSTFPKDQEDLGAIIGLGSVIEIDGRDNFPYIGMWDLERVLGLRYCSEEGWNDFCRFLVIREIS